jgi:SAM-dependent methyltransferase
MTYRLFGELAEHYDRHTPPWHYQDDHEFVLRLARQNQTRRLLDIGCGTGVLLQKARASGIDAVGIDASTEMVRECARKIGIGTARVQKMETLDEDAEYDFVCALSWTIHYAKDDNSFSDVVRRIRRALRGGGIMLLQLAHAAHATGEIFSDYEPGVDGTTGDVRFSYQFARSTKSSSEMRAIYGYSCTAEGVSLNESHTLVHADAYRVEALARNAGFREVRLVNSCHEDPFTTAIAPFLIAHR